LLTRLTELSSSSKSEFEVEDGPIYIEENEDVDFADIKSEVIAAVWLEMRITNYSAH
jgi:hypothetical protein